MEFFAEVELAAMSRPELEAVCDALTEFNETSWTDHTDQDLIDFILDFQESASKGESK